METLNMNGRRWIDNYEGLYSCNPQGQIFRHWKTKTTAVKGYISKNKHVVKLSKDKKVKECITSRLIYETWVGTIPPGYVIVKINKTITDNHVNNLKLMALKERSKITGPKSRSKAVELLDENGKVIDSWPSARKAAKDLFVSYQTVIGICNRKVKKKLVNVRWERATS